MSRLAFATVVALALSLVLTESPDATAAQPAGGIVASMDGLYDIKPSEGVADVSWSVSLTNTGPSPFLSPDDPANHPSTVEIFLPSGYSNFQATSSFGAPLAATFEDTVFGKIAHLQLGYSMPYGDTFSFNYAFTQSGSDEDGTYISPAYIYLLAYPGVLTYDYSSRTLTLVMPNEVAANASFEWASCEGEVQGPSTVFACAGGIADLEVIDAAARLSVTKDIDVNGREVDFIVRYWAGDEDWAARAEKLMVDALPIYADIFGAPYAGPGTIRLSERGGSEIYGALGVAYCQNTICALAATPTADDQVILHEISHMWSDAFDNHWLIEGIAEYVSLKAAGILGTPGYEEFADPQKAPQATSRAWNMPEDVVTATAPRTQLDPWGGPWSIGADDEVTVSEGYSWGARFWQEIEIRHGPEPFQKVMADIQWKVSDGSIDSEAIMDRLEDVAGITADDLFKSYIFPDEVHAILDQRRDVRDRLTALEARRTNEAPELDGAVLAPVRDAIQEWRFDDAGESLGQLEGALEAYLPVREELEGLRSEASAAGLSFPAPWEEGNRTWAVDPEVIGELDAAYEALEAYVAAKADVDASRGIFERIGLLGKDDHADLNDAAGHFSWARFDESVASSQAAQAMIEGLHGDGVTRALVTGVVVASMVIFIVTVYVVSRRKEAESQPGAEAMG